MLAMSQIGQKATWRPVLAARLGHVRFTPESGRSVDEPKCLLCASSCFRKPADPALMPKPSRTSRCQIDAYQTDAESFGKFALTPRNANNLSPTAVEGSFARAMVE
jgi:hypothetical protein